MKKISVTSGLVLAVFLSSCAPSMDGYSRGFFASPVGEDGYYVSYGSNGLSSAQYSQIYWLYNCAKLTLMRGYDGFHFESDIKMSDDIDYGLIQQGGGYGTIFAAGLVFGAVASDFQDNIKMLKKPFDQDTPRVFDAMTVMNLLAPCVEGNSSRADCEQALNTLAQMARARP